MGVKKDTLRGTIVYFIEGDEKRGYEVEEVILDSVSETYVAFYHKYLHKVESRYEDVIIIPREREIDFLRNMPEMVENDLHKSGGFIYNDESSANSRAYSLNRDLVNKVYTLHKRLEKKFDLTKQRYDERRGEEK